MQLHTHKDACTNLIGGLEELSLTLGMSNYTPEKQIDCKSDYLSMS